MGISNDIFVAKESFSVTLNGAPYAIHKGIDRVRKGHPILKGREHLFEPLSVQYDVEQATAAPSEQRGAPAPTQTPVATPIPKVGPTAAKSADADFVDQIVASKRGEK
jgi:hypothetical protein